MSEYRGLIYLSNGERVNCNAWSSDTAMWSDSAEPKEWPEDLKLLHGICDDCGRGDGHDSDCFYHGPY